RGLRVARATHRRGARSSAARAPRHDVRRVSGAAAGAVMASLTRAWLAALALAAASDAGAADALLPDLEQRLARNGADAVNAHLVAHWSQAMVPLNQKTATCELHAVSLAARLSRSANERAVRAHGEALRAASGNCPRFVLAMVSQAEVPRYCG